LSHVLNPDPSFSRIVLGIDAPIFQVRLLRDDVNGVEYLAGSENYMAGVIKEFSISAWLDALQCYLDMCGQPRISGHAASGARSAMSRTAYRKDFLSASKVNWRCNAMAHIDKQVKEKRRKRLRTTISIVSGGLDESRVRFSWRNHRAKAHYSAFGSSSECDRRDLAPLDRRGANNNFLAIWLSGLFPSIGCHDGEDVPVAAKEILAQ